ncbi:Mrp/NBP35 family ATP-binding protein [Gemmata sp. G18]|uniref:Iron-sulfur cluster carrier protein n=1 Tax=Gemmata palustris TaxID=2822762 RepID=A0ABS5BKG1_9BACT|nr:Mrp/NBP35 family ATP-binding protein [Gemmata palustris]MBP3954197.1 Mrp/NBP35 family ATP-binding protein [Gemmata palustris]
MNPQMPPKVSLPGVKQVIAVASGKGGVGKSTVAANLAMALHMSGKAVGLMDADIYGPSVPIMFGLGMVDPKTTAFPIERYGIRLMSMGFLVDVNQAVIWRGPKVAQAVQSFLTQIDWGQLDYLIIDLPPGTGDAQLTLSQSAPLTGAVVVTTPGEVSLIDARKGVKMFGEVRVPILGIVENMSYFEDAAGNKTPIFGVGGGSKLAEESGVPFLGELPIDPRVAQCGDHGEPIVRKYPDSAVAKAYLALARTVADVANKPAAPALPHVQL